VACNTASALALDALRATLSVPVIGVVEPTAAAAVERSKSGRIGIIGTPGTINSGAYEREVMRLRPDAVTFARPCPLFVPLAEEGWTSGDDPIAKAVAERYLAPFRDEKIDTLILGCTHYPLLEAILTDTLPGVLLADAAEAVAAADAVAEALGGELGASPAEGPLRRYYVTDVPKGFRMVAERFLGRPIDELVEVDLG
jgi:glutamate racemase